MGGQWDWEGKRRFTHRIEHLFCVAVYSVTVAQFDLFIQDGGYERQFHKDDPTQRIWTDAGWQWRERERRKRPDDYASAFQTPNHPRVGVTRYEAVAFCNWLNAAFTPQELKLPEGWKVRLPAEAEWERAARHTDGRDFPWDLNDKTQPAIFCNCRETGLGQTSAVGLFPSGKALCGAHDMAGNVWEWCLTKWRDDYKEYEKVVDNDLKSDSVRVLRGGSWNDEASLARCAGRVSYRPLYRHNSVGFRMVASPFLCSEL